MGHREEACFPQKQRELLYNYTSYAYNVQSERGGEKKKNPGS